MPKVYSKRVKGYPSDAVYVGRPTKFGNPFVVGVHGKQGECVGMYEDWVRNKHELVAAIKAELKGKDLLCWCAPEPCHADVLLRIANDP
jgi:hypothetical protein